MSSFIQLDREEYDALQQNIRNKESEILALKAANRDHQMRAEEDAMTVACLVYDRDHFVTLVESARVERDHWRELYQIQVLKNSAHQV